jgi:hypothetical protein
MRRWIGQGIDVSKKGYYGNNITNFK